MLIETTGPDHSKTFKVSCVVNGKVMGYGTAKSKKKAEKIAAQHALENLI